MADNQKYYYMRLKENFFESEEILLLEAMPDGLVYENILLKMYCRSLKNAGRLVFNDLLPYNAAMLASVTRHQIGTVEKALDVFEKLGLIEVLDNGAIYMLNIQDFIGKASTEAERKREYRTKIQTEKQTKKQSVGQIADKCPDNVPQNPDKCSREIEIEQEIEIELEQEREEKEAKRKRFVAPTLEELKAYISEKGYTFDAERFLNYYESNGWRVGKNPMKSWKSACANWQARQSEYGKAETPKKPESKPSYDADEVEQHWAQQYRE